MERLEKALEFLMERLSINVERVKNNSAVAKELIAKDPFSEGLEAIRAENKIILDENRELLSLQISIRKYLSVYVKNDRKIQSSTYKSNKTVDEWYDLTIKGEVELDSGHPMATNLEFLNKILTFYKEKEEYEKCVRISKMIETVKYLQ